MARLLRQGDTDEDVKMLQAVLNYHRVAPTERILMADGSFGPKTNQRVKSFQTQNQLSPDGIVGPNTGNMLMTICHFSAEYVVTRDPTEVAITSGPGDTTTVTREYELTNGLEFTLNPWVKPPAMPKYVLEFEASWVVKNPNLPGQVALSIGGEIGRMLVTRSPDAPYTYTGAGKVTGKFTKDFTLGPIKLDSGI